LAARALLELLAVESAAVVVSPPPTSAEDGSSALASRVTPLVIFRLNAENIPDPPDGLLLDASEPSAAALPSLLPSVTLTLTAGDAAAPAPPLPAAATAACFVVAAASFENIPPLLVVVVVADASAEGSGAVSPDGAVDARWCKATG
jgi:hypothetical protein